MRFDGLSSFERNFAHESLSGGFASFLPFSSPPSLVLKVSCVWQERAALYESPFLQLIKAKTQLTVRIHASSLFFNFFSSPCISIPSPAASARLLCNTSKPPFIPFQRCSPLPRTSNSTRRHLSCSAITTISLSFKSYPDFATTLDANFCFPIVRLLLDSTLPPLRPIACHIAIVGRILLLRYYLGYPILVVGAVVADTYLCVCQTLQGRCKHCKTAGERCGAELSCLVSLPPCFQRLMSAALCFDAY